MVQVNNTFLLLDIGYNYNSVVTALNNLGVSPEQIEGIVVTHEHTDHVSSLTMWSRYFDTPVYLPTAILHEVINKTYCTRVVELDGKPFVVGSANVDMFCCSHDARACYGYRFGDGTNFVACVTDTGVASDELADFLLPCSTVMLESNHDEAMLKNGSYPYPLKQRILSQFGHLSNQQTAVILQKILGKNVKNIVLAHLSEHNNTPELAFASALCVCNSLGIVEGRDVNIYVANQHKNGVTFEN